MNARQRATDVRCWPVEEWPTVDQEAWSASLRPGDDFEPGGLAATWSEETVKLTASGYGRWLAWIHSEGLLAPDQTPASRATVDRARAYADVLSKYNAPFSVIGRIRQLGNALRAIAPDRDWGWMIRAADRLRSEAKPVRDTRSRLIAPDRLEALGVSIMEEADRDATLTGPRRAADFRDGLIIALLAKRPFRMRNLAMIAMNRHLTQEGCGWLLAFTAEEMKTPRPLQAPFPESLLGHLQRYLSVHRPVLLDVGLRHGHGPTDALWLSSHGGAAGRAIIALQITQRTQAAFGKPVNPHAFRHSAATWIAVNAPEEAPIIAAILGHATMGMADRYYNLARGLEASRRFQSVIAHHRRPLKTARAAKLGEA
jgi:integrase/recombinase XerD